MDAALFRAALGRHEGPQVALVEDLEAGGRDADYGEGLAVERDGAADNGRVGGEARVPEELADDDDVGAGAAVIGGKGAAGEEGDAQEGEEFLRDRLAGNALRAVGRLEGAAAAGDGGHGGEDGVAVVPVEEVEGRGAVVDVAGRVFPQHDEAVRLVVGEGAEERGVHYGEDGGVGADA